MGRWESLPPQCANPAVRMHTRCCILIPIDMETHCDDDNCASAGETIFTPGNIKSRTAAKVRATPSITRLRGPAGALRARLRGGRASCPQLQPRAAHAAVFEEPFSERGTELSAKHESSEHRKPYFIAF